jgi:ABC-2 type transport system permease protein
MNNVMVKRLVLKDWYFLRPAIITYLLAGVGAIMLLRAGSEGLFYAGSILLITILITVGIHLIFATVVAERAEHTLPFVMSLPISAAEYTTAKIVANLLIFLVPWVTLILGTLTIIGLTPDIPDGLIPFVVLLFTQILVGYCLLLAVALVSESTGWTIVALVVGNLSFQFFMYAVSHIEGIASSMKGALAVWNQPALLLLAGQVGAVGLMLVLTFYLQGRKTDFL